VSVDDEGRETLVPALMDVILDVDRTARRITVAEVPGLTSPEERPA
jgi:ribosomal 30S subunit maturation factor RimM